MFCIPLPFQSFFCFFYFYFSLLFVAWMFSLIPKTDTGLWLGPLSSVHQLLFYLSRAVGSKLTLFFIVPVPTGRMAVENYYYALERVKIVDPQPISPLSSLIVSTPHHAENQVPSQAAATRQSSQNESFFFLYVSRSSTKQFCPSPDWKQRGAFFIF